MWAMIPMLRTLARSSVRRSVAIAVRSLPCRFVGLGSPAVVREGLVGLRHLVGVLAALHAGAKAIGGVEDLVHQALGHRLFATRPRVADQPPQCECGAAAGPDLDRHLVGRPTD